jgi:hypothetical protein
MPKREIDVETIVIKLLRLFGFVVALMLIEELGIKPRLVSEKLRSDAFPIKTTVPEQLFVTEFQVPLRQRSKVTSLIFPFPEDADWVMETKKLLIVDDPEFVKVKNR